MKKHNFAHPGNRVLSKKTTLISALFFSMLLSACETPVLTKAGGQHLKAGDQIILTNGNLDQARAAYEQALQSDYPDVKAQAAYNLAMIAREQGRNEQPYLEQAAAANHMAARLELADLYKRQNRLADVERLSLSLSDTSAAANINLLERAHEKGRAADAALYAAQAETILLQQTTANDPEGQKSLMLGRLYAVYGDYFDSPRDAETYYRRAIAKGNVKAVQELAELWNQPGAQQHSPNDVFALMIQAAEAGNETAIKYVGSAYEEGRGVPRDIDKAMDWNKKSKGRMKNSTLISLAHASVKTDPQKAITLFSKAADQGSAEAALMVYGLKKDAPKNLQAYGERRPDSLYGIVKHLEETYGKTNPDMIDRQYRLAAEIGSGKAALRLAQNAAPGSDDQEKWYKKAAESGNQKAMLMLARTYKIGADGKAADEKEAFHWFEKAANAGEAEGQYETGVSYARGIGVKKDTQKAREWLEKAQAGGYHLAVEVLKSIESGE